MLLEFVEAMPADAVWDAGLVIDCMDVGSSIVVEATGCAVVEADVSVKADGTVDVYLASAPDTKVIEYIMATLLFPEVESESIEDCSLDEACPELEDVDMMSDSEVERMVLEVDIELVEAEVRRTKLLVAVIQPTCIGGLPAIVNRPVT